MGELDRYGAFTPVAFVGAAWQGDFYGPHWNLDAMTFRDEASACTGPPASGHGSSKSRFSSSAIGIGGLEVEREARAADRAEVEPDRQRHHEQQQEEDLNRRLHDEHARMSVCNCGERMYPTG
jgi:hypothetical protein